MTEANEIDKKKFSQRGKAEHRQGAIEIKRMFLKGRCQPYTYYRKNNTTTKTCPLNLQT